MKKAAQKSPFDQAVAKLRQDGLSPIKRMKYRMQLYETPAKHNIPASERPVPVDFIRYGLKAGVLKEGEFWIPTGYDGYEAWVEELCAPHWLTSPIKKSMVPQTSN